MDKKINIPIDAVPVYALNTILNSFVLLGFTVTDLAIQVSDTDLDPEDAKFVVISFKITGGVGFPSSADSSVLLPATGQILIYTAETIHPDHYYIQDVISTNLTVEELTGDREFRSFSVDTVLHALVKSLVIIRESEDGPAA